MLTSIRWRLPLSYAAIALLTAAALGGTLLLALGGYYADRERAFLSSNARAIAATLAPSIAQGLPRAALESQLESIAFLSQAQARLLDPAGGELAVAKAAEAVSVGWVASASAEGVVYTPVISIGDIALATVTIAVEPNAGQPAAGEQGGAPGAAAQGQAGPPPAGTTQTLAVAASPFGLGLSWDGDGGLGRSAVVVREPVRDAAGATLGYVELSGGPAYGRAIMASVAWGVGGAGGAAVLLAALAGLLASRWVTGPVLALAATTERMAGGDLAARAEARGDQELRALALAFNMMAARVEMTVGALRRFVADAAHELHTPITTLRSSLDLLSDEPDEARRERLVARARVQSRRLQELTDDLLDLSRLDGGAPPPRDRLDLAELLGTLAEGYASQAEQAGLSFSLELPASPVIIYGYRAQLGRAVGNLVGNAVKFTPEGGAVRLALAATGDAAQISVRDTGIGIPPDDLPRLTERFRRGRNAAAIPGSGLGLAIVRAVAEGHRGTLQVSSGIGGTLVELTLPLADPGVEARR